MLDTTWTIMGGRVLGPAPFFIAGIVNVTPDSFFDGGEHAAAGEGIAHGLELKAQGAHILDVGGESTRPYAEYVSAEEELKRVVPVVSGLIETCDDVVISIDTYKASVARAALEAGATIINDVSAFAFDLALLDVIAEYKPGYVLMHSLGKPEDMQDAPSYIDVVDDIRAFFEGKLNQLAKAGLPEDRIVLDPGVGFGKLLEHNVDIIRRLDEFSCFGLPLYMGLSNKSLWQGLLGLGVGERDNATQAGTAVSAMKGAAVHRVHNVALTRQTLTIVHKMA